MSCVVNSGEQWNSLLHVIGYRLSPDLAFKVNWAWQIITSLCPDCWQLRKKRRKKRFLMTVESFKCKLLWCVVYQCKFVRRINLPQSQKQPCFLYLLIFTHSQACVISFIRHLSMPIMTTWCTSSPVYTLWLESTCIPDFTISLVQL